MGLLVDGQWRDEWYDTKSTNGRFERQMSSFRDWIGSDKFKASANRYHLYIAHACPWAHRVAIFRRLKGLENIITMSAVDSLMLANGWEMKRGGDPVSGKQYLHEVYTSADAHFSGRVTVPLLWDKETGTIVNNESSELIRMFNSAFDDITGNRNDYYPEELRSEIDAVNAFVYDAINNGVYKAGFATVQSVYEEEVTALFSALDAIEARLEGCDYLVGGQMTEADIRLLTTLVRFDPVYVGHFKCNLRRIQDYPNLSRYVRALTEIPGIKETIHIDEIKRHYYGSHKHLNPTGIIPLGPL